MMRKEEDVGGQDLRCETYVFKRRTAKVLETGDRVPILYCG